MVKPGDVPVYVESGAADLGVTGTDVLRETGADVLEPLELGFGFCRLVVASPGSAPYPQLEGGITARVATKYPRLAQAHFAAAGRPVDIIQVNGSVEVAPLLRLSHWIVDLVDTGNTLRANGLVERETILECGAVLVANRASQKLKLEAYLGLMERLERAGECVTGEAYGAAVVLSEAKETCALGSFASLRMTRRPRTLRSLRQRPPPLDRASACSTGPPALPRDVERGPVIGGGARKRQAERDVHRAPERRDLDRGHPDVVIRREHRVELAPHRAHEHGIRRQWAGGAERLGGRPEHPVLLVAEETRFAGVRIDRAEREPGPLDSPPLPEPALGDASGPDDPVQGEQRRHVAERHVGRHQHHAQLLRGEHHRDVHVAGEVREPFGVSGIGKAGEMEGVLLRRRGDDRVHLARERELDRGLDRVAGEPARPDRAARSSGRSPLPCPQVPTGTAARGRDRRDLVLRADQRHLGVERLLQRAGGDLRPDAARIAERDSDAGQRAPPPRCPLPATLRHRSPRRSSSAADRCSAGWPAPGRAAGGSGP